MALLWLVKAAQRLGFTLDEVAELLYASRRRRPTPDLQAREQAKLVEFDSRMVDLSQVREGLVQVINALRQPDELHLRGLSTAVRRVGES